MLWYDTCCVIRSYCGIHGASYKRIIIVEDGTWLASDVGNESALSNANRLSEQFRVADKAVPFRPRKQRRLFAENNVW